MMHFPPDMEEFDYYKETSCMIYEQYCIKLIVSLSLYSGVKLIVIKVRL